MGTRRGGDAPRGRGPCTPSVAASVQQLSTARRPPPTPPHPTRAPPAEYGQQLKQLQEAARRARKRHAGARAHAAFVGDDEAEGVEGGGEGLTAEEEAEEAAEQRHAAELARELQVGRKGAGGWGRWMAG